jgi:hypothetical protein
LFDVYMVGAGGGSGFGFNSSAGGGGGGAGGLLVQTIYLSETTHAVDIGAGGAAGTNSVTNAGKIGFGSSIGSRTEGVQIAGGAGGWGYTQQQPGAGANGAGGPFLSIPGSSPLTPIGFAGGAGGASVGGAGGGGGHTGAGGDAL